MKDRNIVYDFVVYKFIVQNDKNIYTFSYHHTTTFKQSAAFKSSVLFSCFWLLLWFWLFVNFIVNKMLLNICNFFAKKLHLKVATEDTHRHQNESLSHSLNRNEIGFVYIFVMCFSFHSLRIHMGQLIPIRNTRFSTFIALVIILRNLEHRLIFSVDQTNVLNTL